MKRISFKVLLVEDSTRDVCQLVKDQTAFSFWPEDIKHAFLQAFFQDENRLGVVEYNKMLTGRKHLGIPEHETIRDKPTRLAERFRADLTGLIKFKSLKWITFN